MNTESITSNSYYLIWLHCTRMKQQTESKFQLDILTLAKYYIFAQLANIYCSLQNLRVSSSKTFLGEARSWHRNNVMPILHWHMFPIPLDYYTIQIANV